MILANGIKIKPTIFPDNTSQVWKTHIPLKGSIEFNLESESTMELIWYFEEEREIIDLLSLRKIYSDSKWKLHIPYLPYARQDKPVDNFNTFNLQVFSDLVNLLNCEEVSSMDVHNPKLTTALIKNFVNIDPTEVQKAVISICKPDYLVYPDHGARNRYSLKDLKLKEIIFNKERSPDNGVILNHEATYHGAPFVHCAEDLVNNGDKFLIIDDICDGGATFISIANKLKQNSNKEILLYLFVTHGLFSNQAEKKLKANGIKTYTTNSLLRNKANLNTVNTEWT